MAAKKRDHRAIAARRAKRRVLEAGIRKERAKTAARRKAQPLARKPTKLVSPKAKGVIADLIAKQVKLTGSVRVTRGQLYDGTLLAPKMVAGVLKIVTLPIHKVKVARENPRFGLPVDDAEGITASVKAYGQLQEFIGYEEKGFAWATDGARRLHGMNAAKFGHVRIAIYPKAEAIERGIAAQTQRVNLNPAVEAKAFARMLTDGRKPEQVARDFGRTVRYVEQRQRLAGLHAPILDALRKEQISIDLAAAYANAPATRQEALWKVCGSRASPRQVRHQLSQKEVAASDPLALFVGQEAYTAAGGQVGQDLFSFDRYDDEMDDRRAGETWFRDRKVVEKLAGDKLQDAVETWKAKGFKKIEAAAEIPYGWKWASGCSLISAPPTDAKQKARAELFITIGDKGGVSVVCRIRGAVTKQKNGKTTAAPAKAAPMTKSANELLTATAGEIVGHALPKAAGLGVAVILAQAARMAFGKRHDDRGILALQGDASLRYPHRPIADRQLTLKTDETHAALVATWEDFAERNKASLEGAIIALSPAKLSEFAGVVASCFINTREMYGENKPRRTVLAGVARLAKVKPADHFAPDAELLRGFSLDTLKAAARAMKIEAPEKKGKLAEAVAIAAADKRWLPDVVVKMIGGK